MQYMEGLIAEDVECPLGFLWEDQSWGGLSYSDDDDNNSSPKEKALSPPPPPPTGVVLREEANAELAPLALVNNKRGRGGKSSNAADAVRKGKRVMAAGGGGELGGKDHELHIWTERERRKKMRNMFAGLHQLLPQLPPKADKSSIVDEAVSFIKHLQQTAANLEKLIREKNRTITPIGCESSVTNPNWTPYESPRDKAIVIAAADQASSNNNLLAGYARGVPNSSSSTSSPASSFAPPQQPAVTLKTWASPNVVLNIFGDEAEFSICAAKKPGLLTTIAFVLDKYRIDVISANIFCNRIANRYIIVAHANEALLKFPEANSVDEIFKRAAGEIMMWAS